MPNKKSFFLLLSVALCIYFCRRDNFSPRQIKFLSYIPSRLNQTLAFQYDPRNA